MRRCINQDEVKGPGISTVTYQILGRIVAPVQDTSIRIERALLYEETGTLRDKMSFIPVGLFPQVEIL